MLQRHGPADATPLAPLTPDVLALDCSLVELYAFVVLAEELSFTRAARRLHVTQPGLSSRIARLERAVGVRLFERSSRHVALTPSGARMVAGVHSALLTLARVTADARCEARPAPGDRQQRAGDRIHPRHAAAPRVLRPS